RLQERLRTRPLPRSSARVEPEFAVFISLLLDLNFSSRLNYTKKRATITATRNQGTPYQKP
ncbi:MAG: hypothetical protein ACUVRR_11025, partial [Candidatus Fervidibacter sp.]|uniref:hypothetical protein n=1 Tax=Candidatus Fervidibacter sp. TaxID=3100871 RepID=UPI00404B491F